MKRSSAVKAGRGIDEIENVRRDGVWMHYGVSASLDPVVQKVVSAASDALREVPATGQHRKQFERTFGELYVLDAPGGGSCCAPGG